MTNLLKSRKAVLVKGALMSFLAPKLAQDAKIDLNPVLDGVTAKNYDAMVPTMSTRLPAALKGKLAQDADIDDAVKIIEAMQGVEEAEAEEAAAQQGAPVEDEEPESRKFLKGKLSAEDLKAFDDECAKEKAAMDEDDETDEARKKRLEREKAEDRRATDSAIATALADERKNAAAIREAERDVRPHVGEIAPPKGKVAFDSAAEVYRVALDALGVDHRGVHESAYRHLLPKAKRGETSPFAQDAAAAKGFETRFPNAARIGVAS